MSKCTQCQGSINSIFKGKQNNTDIGEVVSDDQARPRTKKIKTQSTNGHITMKNKIRCPVLVGESFKIAKT